VRCRGTIRDQPRLDRVNTFPIEGHLLEHLRSRGPLLAFALQPGCYPCPAAIVDYRRTVGRTTAPVRTASTPFRTRRSVCAATCGPQKPAKVFVAQNSRIRPKYPQSECRRWPGAAGGNCNSPQTSPSRARLTDRRYSNAEPGVSDPNRASHNLRSPEHIGPR
jgi:hypothetical protein